VTLRLSQHIDLKYAASTQCRRNPLLDRRKYARFKPRVLLEPDRVSGRRMRQDDRVRQKLLIRCNSFRQILVSNTEMRFERIVPKIDGEFQRPQQRKQFPMPLRSTFGTGSDVALTSGAGKTETHRDNSDSGTIIESLTGDPEPGAQAVTAPIIPRHPRLVSSASRRLPYQDDPRCRVSCQQWSWP
jgi:hypothetical protein